jgi:hypothetical protein
VQQPNGRLHCLLLVLAFVLFACLDGNSQPQPALYIKAFGVRQVQECATLIKALSAELQTLHFPRGWTIAIACTPVAWNESLRLAEYPPTASAFTSLRTRITVLNGAIFSGLRTEYRSSIAHELGHIICDCANEVRAGVAARRLERENIAVAEEIKAGGHRVSR